MLHATHAGPQLVGIRLVMLEIRQRPSGPVTLHLRLVGVPGMRATRRRLQVRYQSEDGLPWWNWLLWLCRALAIRH